MASNSIKWYKKIFGEKLIQCEEVSNDNLNVGEKKNYVSIDVIFDSFFKFHKDDVQLVIGLYFSPIEGVPDECTNYLIQLYHLINHRNGVPNANVYDKNFKMKQQCKTFLEVIHVFLANSVHWLDRCTIDESKVLDQLKDFPWYAVPVEERDKTVSSNYLKRKKNF